MSLFAQANLRQCAGPRDFDHVRDLALAYRYYLEKKIKLSHVYRLSRLYARYLYRDN